jgi:hypothetical protein
MELILTNAFKSSGRARGPISRLVIIRTTSREAEGSWRRTVGAGGAKEGRRRAELQISGEQAWSRGGQATVVAKQA